MKFFLTLILFVISISDLFAMELPEGIHRLSGFDAMAPMDELIPLKKMIGKSEYVGIGEAIHTAGGYSDGRFHITRFLIEKMGFRSVGIEAPWSAVLPINKYVQTCKGSPTEAGVNIYRAWKDQGFIDFIHWACQYNQKHLKDPIFFYGFDTNYQLGYAADAIKNYLLKTAPQKVEALTSGLNKCFGVEYKTIKEFRAYALGLYASGSINISKEDNETCLNAVNNISTYLNKNKIKLTQKSSKKDLSWASIILTTIQYDQLHYFSMNKNSNAEYDPRDLGMAKLIPLIKDVEGLKTRTVLWAHNAHLNKNPHKMVPEDLREYKMGEFLARSLGKKYFPIAQIGYSVAVDDKDFYDAPTKITVQPKSTDPRSLEFIMHNFGSPGILADSKSDLFLPGVYKSQWMTDATEFVPREQFDAYIFHEETRMFIPWKDPNQ